MSHFTTLDKKQFYLYTEGGEALLVEIDERHGWVAMGIGQASYVITPSDAFDLADSLIMVANDASLVGEE